ncbi:LamB/YcsF family protein [Coralloluteibacterium stylophorae]|uniref:LamB/YcsF family protein n=1 Tax=Coralloluteibacterium stylophorae TaxID=1776034 RepID=A0A8J7VXI4_9GAMM|nr:5-oxoprolinase subunit PxpA [Coralloluteibacterium stylophorae]MBS7458737.1 LamB/YcsF family protein [Coralloluteibacterium stylophorae]
MRIDFNCDLGEGCGDDAAILPWITSANVACGGHAGDDDSMRATVAACLEHGVAVGAHPSFPDRAGFGRRALVMTPAAIADFVAGQIEALAAVCRREGARLVHVKPHGALYNLAAQDRAVADSIARAVAAHDAGLRLVGLAGSRLLAAGRAAGLAVAGEAFAERRYEAGGSLTPRALPGASIEVLEDAIEQVRMLVREGAVVARTGERVAVRADTLCLHGDRPDAAAFARTLRRALDGCGVRVAAPGAEA